MKTLTDRQEIAKAMNFGEYPILYLDLAKDELKEDYLKGCYQGQRVKIARNRNGETFYSHGTLSYWKDENKLSISSEAIMLTASFGFSDIQKMVENANATEIKGDQEVIVVIMNSKTQKTSYPFLTKTSRYVPNCQTAMTIEGDFKEIIEMLK